MLYLSGCIRASIHEYPDMGYIITPGRGGLTHLATAPWAADNGCFAQGDSFRLGRYITWLEERVSAYRSSCLFATAPDVVGDAEATWLRSASILPLIRSLGYRAALVAQDGMEEQGVVEWDAFDALFIGGTTEWKLSHHAARVAEEARRYGKHVHMGRVNSRKRVVAALSMGCDSIDGTFLNYAPEQNIHRLRKWMALAQRQPALWSQRVATSHADDEREEVG